MQTKVSQADSHNIRYPLYGNAHRVDDVEVCPGAVAHPADDELAHGVEDADEGDEEGGVGELEVQVPLGVVNQVDVPEARLKICSSFSWISNS